MSKAPAGMSASWRARRRLLATTSLVALVAAAAAPSPAQAQCNTTYSNTSVAACTNTGTITQLHYTNATVSGTVTNAGTISPGGIVLTSSTQFGAILDTGTIAGGIMIDAQSSLNAGPGGITVSSTPTFGGGITNAGSIIPAGGVAIQVIQTSLFTGGILNSGTISAATNSPGQGIAIQVGGTSGGPVSTFSGDVSNSGTLNARRTGVLVTHVSIFSGNITNSGALTAGLTGVQVSNTSTFSGNISNSGTLTSGPTGVHVSNLVLFSGNIANSGTVAAAAGDGILVQGVSRFAGGVTNSKLITAATNGIEVGGITPTSLVVSTFTGGVANSGTITVTNGAGIRVAGQISSVQIAGGIANTGTINANTAGIELLQVSTFAGGISNGGAIVLSPTIGPLINPGINVEGVSTFSGGIINTGSISAPGGVGQGIFVGAIGTSADAVQTFLGGVTNAGTISAAGGIGIAIGAGGTSMTTFDGGVVNSGTLTAAVGIAFGNISTFSGGIANSGNITGTAGTAIDAHLLHNAITINQTAGTITGAILLSGQANTLNVTGGAINGNIVGLNAGNSITFALGAGTTFTYSNTISGENVVNVNTGTVQLDGAIASAIGGTALTIAPAGTLLVGTGGSVAPDVTDNGVFGFNQTGTSSYGGVISGTGVVEQLGPGTTTLAGTNSYSGGTLITGGTLAVSADANLGAASGGLTLGGGTLQFLGSFASARNVTLNAGGGTFDTNGNNDQLNGPIGGAGGLTKIGAGTLTLGGASSYTGPTQVNGGTLQAGATNAFAPASAFTIASGATLALNSFNQTIGSLTGPAGSAVTLGSAILTEGGDNSSTTFAGSISGIGGGLTKVGGGTFVLSGTSGYTGATTINGGTLEVDGALTGSSSANVNAGGTLAGIGAMTSAVFVNSGGTLRPGNPANQLGTLHITGGLTFAANSTYAVQIAPGAGNNSSTIVTGTAVINGGTVVVTPRIGSYGATNYVIVQTSGGVTGQFASLQVNGNFTGTMTLDYTTIPGDVLLDIGPGAVIMAMPTGTNVNQQNVLNGINNGMLAGNALPPQLANLATLSNAAELAALTQLSGENSAGFFQGAFQAGNSFLNMMVNPFLDGRFGNGGGFGAAMGFAAEEPPALPQAALAFASAMPVKAAPAPATFAQRFSAWGGAYGGSGRVTGDPAVGSHDTTARAAAFAAGVDYRLSPDTIVGFALAGGGTSWDLAAGLGGGSSDMFQAGVYGSHRWGAAYLSGAIAYNLHDVTTNRTITVAGTDMLTSRFRANGVGARLEGGYRYATPWLGFTPYAAAQVQSIALPSYGETATAGSNQFALNFASQTATTTRTELGAWLDRSTRMGSGALLTLYGRAAWAHDFGDTPAASAIFQALPGSNFIVNGAAPARDGALVTGAAQYSLASGWSFVAKFDGEFSSTTSVYSGSGMVRKTW